MCQRPLSDQVLIGYLKDPFGDAGAIADHLDQCPECDQRSEQLRLELGTSPPSPESIEKILLLDFPASSVPEDLKPKVEGYEILGEIGRGGMGVVYKAWHSKHLTVALKVLLREALATASDVEQARREAREAQSAWDQAVSSGDSNPPFLRVYEVGETEDGVHFISMELAPAGTLQDRLQDLFAKPVLAAGIVRTVASAVHAMHVRGVVHRDLTLGNILLRVKGGRKIQGSPKTAPLEDLEPIVSDYGLSKRMKPAGEANYGGFNTTPLASTALTMVAPDNRCNRAGRSAQSAAARHDGSPVP